MLGFGLTKAERRTAIAKSAQQLVRPAPVSHRTESRLDEYLALAKELGVGAADNGKVLQMEVADFLWENDIDMYDYMEVEKYLVDLGRRLYNGKELVWKPLRVCDSLDLGMGWHRSHYEKKVYDRVVPFEVLKNVKLLTDKFGDKLKILISDFEVVNPDPFIIATARNMDRVVFGVWDEPAFFNGK